MDLYKTSNNEIKYYTTNNQVDLTETIDSNDTNARDLTLAPAFRLLAELGVMRKDHALVGNGFTYGLYPTFINNVLQDKPRLTVPEPEDTPMYQNGEGQNAE